ncbi:MAG: 23S rRNA (uracil(1939)-C(5))-methyltransferase RlmD, partial [Planctomycetota bacterium]
DYSAVFCQVLPNPEAPPNKAPVLPGPWTVILRRALPGDRLIARALKRRGDKIEARVERWVERSEHLEEARCPHFGPCGGCSFQNFRYESQLDELHRLLAEAFRSRPALAQAMERAGVTVERPLGAEDPWRYRNKMEFGYGNRRYVLESEPEDADRSFALGLHAPGRFDKVLDVKQCHIQAERCDSILESARELALEQGLTPWDAREHVGLLRHLVLRTARAYGGQTMINLVTSEEAPEQIGPYVEALLERHPDVTTIVQNITSSVAGVARGEREICLHGPGRIVEQLAGLDFSISAGSFFQTNSAQAERLVEIVRELAEASRTDLLCDVYCGAGSLSLPLALDARKVIGYEVVPEAVADAHSNAEAGGIENVNFIAGDVLETLDVESVRRADILVVDPPRAGVHPKVLERLLEPGPRRLIYVSCNPYRGVDEFERITMAGYTPKRVVPVDLFPHTPHVECVVAFERLDPGGETA